MQATQNHPQSKVHASTQTQSGSKVKTQLSRNQKISLTYRSDDQLDSQLHSLLHTQLHDPLHGAVEQKNFNSALRFLCLLAFCVVSLEICSCNKFVESSVVVGPTIETGSAKLNPRKFSLQAPSCCIRNSQDSVVVPGVNILSDADSRINLRVDTLMLFLDSLQIPGVLCHYDPQTQSSIVSFTVPPQAKDGYFRLRCGKNFDLSAGSISSMRDRDTIMRIRVQMSGVMSVIESSYRNEKDTNWALSLDTANIGELFNPNYYQGNRKENDSGLYIGTTYVVERDYGNPVAHVDYIAELKAENDSSCSFILKRHRTKHLYTGISTHVYTSTNDDSTCICSIKLHKSLKEVLHKGSIELSAFTLLSDLYVSATSYYHSYFFSAPDTTYTTEGKSRLLSTFIKPDARLKIVFE